MIPNSEQRKILMAWGLPVGGGHYAAATRLRALLPQPTPEPEGK